MYGVSRLRVLVKSGLIMTQHSSHCGLEAARSGMLGVGDGHTLWLPVGSSVRQGATPAVSTLRGTHEAPVRYE